jgi:hypothetical protein
MSAKLLDQKLIDQLNAIPSLNEYFNRLPCNTKAWIIEAVKQAFKEWLAEQKVTTGADDSPRLYDSWIDDLIQIISQEGEKQIE